MVSSKDRNKAAGIAKRKSGNLQSWRLGEGMHSLRWHRALQYSLDKLSPELQSSKELLLYFAATTFSAEGTLRSERI